MQIQKYLLALAILSTTFIGCSDSNNASKKAEKIKFPEPTDSLANGKHPYFPTAENILGKWKLHHPVDSSNLHYSVIEFMEDNSVKSENYPFVTPEKWQLNGDTLVIAYKTSETGAGSIIQDTLVVEAVSDTSLHFYYLHEPNFIAHWTR
jgi:hypothetical protein